MISAVARQHEWGTDATCRDDGRAEVVPGASATPMRSLPADAHTLTPFH
jgi:hypothetical protein